MTPGHPECPTRLRVIEDQLRSSGLYDFLRHFEAPRAHPGHLKRVHQKAYVEHILKSSPREGFVHIDPDTSMNPHTVSAALHAAGAVLLATELVSRKVVDNAFCSVRPPGHHAERGQAMGFCFFNNVAVGVAEALEQWGMERVAIVDFDVHHGNGTEDIFRDDMRVMVCSAYQFPLYPFRGMQNVDGHLVNVPLHPGAGGLDFRQAIEEGWIPQLARFEPQMIFISAGFDAHHEDDLAELNLTEADYAWVTQRIMDIADGCAEGRVVSVLEGGYALHALARSVKAHLQTLMRL